jgi:hypothetical protein
MHCRTRGVKVLSGTLSGNTEPAQRYDCQQPGSPGCPQQFCRFTSLTVLFFISRESFFASGIGLERLLTTAFTLGFFFLAHMHGSLKKIRYAVMEKDPLKKSFNDICR